MLVWHYPSGSARPGPFLILIPEKVYFSHKYIILAIVNLVSKVNFLLFLLHYFLVVCVNFPFCLPTVLCAGFTNKL